MGKTFFWHSTLNIVTLSSLFKVLNGDCVHNVDITVSEPFDTFYSTRCSQDVHTIYTSHKGHLTSYNSATQMCTLLSPPTAHAGKKACHEILPITGRLAETGT